MGLSLELLVVVALVVANGVLALSETALVSARTARLERNAQKGSRRAATALRVVRAPEVFLSTVQIGITLVGIGAGAFGGRTLAVELQQVLDRVPELARYSGSLSVGLVVVGITYLTLIFGELVPKRLALTDPERYSGLVARPMSWLSSIGRPLVWLLSNSTDLVLRTLGVRPGQRPEVTEEEITLILERGAAAGRFAQEEPRIVERVFRLADLRVGALSTPRSEIHWLAVDAPQDQVHRQLKRSHRSRLPVCEGDLDQVLGVVRAKHLLRVCLDGERFDLRRELEPVPFVPESAPALNVLEVFRRERLHLAIVMDEYGGVQGLVTTDDILEALVGDIPEPGESTEPEVRREPDGAWLLDGRTSADQLKTMLGVKRLPGEGRGLFKTVGGFTMTQLERMPSEGDAFSWGGFDFEVLKVSGRRVDQVRMARRGPPGGGGRPGQ